MKGSNEILFLVCARMCVSTEESPSSAEKGEDCDVLLEPTLLGPLRGDRSTVSLSRSQCVSLCRLLLFYQCVIFLALTSASSSF